MKGLVLKLFELNANRFFNILYIMTSTVKNYRSAETLFLTLLKTVKLSKIMELEKDFTLTRNRKQDLDDLALRKSDFEEFLEKM